MGASAGIDTWSVCWYVRQGSAPAKAMESLATVPVSRGRKLPDPIGRHSVGWFPEQGMIYAEGHPADDRLAHPSELPAALATLTGDMNDFGILPPEHRIAPMTNLFEVVMPVIGGTGFAGVRRLDTTVDLQRSPSVGSAILNGVAAIEPPGQLRSNVHRSRRLRQIETVTWEGTAGKVARVYDKGIETGTLQRGERVRFEDQRRFRKEHRIPVEAVAEGAAAMMFRARFEPLRRATKGITVTGESGLATKIQQMVDDGELTPAEAAKIAGLLLLQRNGVEVGSRTTRWRNRKAVERAGLILGDSVVQDVEIDLGYEVEEALDTSWETTP